MRIERSPIAAPQIEARTPGLHIAPPPRVEAPTFAPKPPSKSLMERLGASLVPSQLGAWAGRAKALGGAAVLAVMLSGCAGTLPHHDASFTTHAIEGRPAAVEVLSQPTAKEAALYAATSGTSSLSAAFDGLKTIGGGPAEARLLEDNLDAWNARWSALESATSSIHTSYFSLEKDPFGYAYLGHLLKKQREHVPVRLMIDAMADPVGSHGFKLPLRGRDYLQELVNAGSDVSVYHPVHQRPFKLDGYAFMASNHDKILVVDDLVSFTGGRNMAIDYYADPADIPSAWRDTDVMLTGRGPAVAMVKAMDAELQHEHIVSKVSKDRLGNWYKRDLELIGAYLLMDVWLKDSAFTAAEKAALRASPSARAALAADLVQRAVARLPSEQIHRAPADRELTFLTGLAEKLVEQLEARGSRHRYEARQKTDHVTQVKVLDQTSVAGVRVNDFDVGLLQLVQAAKQSIVIQNPYVVLTEDMIKAMTEASRRGVEITILTNSPLSTDSEVTQAFFLEDWAHVLARVPTARVFVATGERKLHMKSATMDDEISIVSSYNLDLLSGYVNSEIGAVMKGRSFTRRMNEVFEADMADPRNGVVEYRIERDARGRAVLEDGAPKVLFGPEDHLPPELLQKYAGKRSFWMGVRDNLPYFRPLRRPALEYGPGV